MRSRSAASSTCRRQYFRSATDTRSRLQNSTAVSAVRSWRARRRCHSASFFRSTPRPMNCLRCRWIRSTGRGYQGLQEWLWCAHTLARRFFVSARSLSESGRLAASWWPGARHGSEAVDVSCRQLVYPSLKDVAVVVDLDEFAPVGGRPASGRDRRRFGWFAEVREDLPNRPRLRRISRAAGAGVRTPRSSRSFRA